MSLDKSSSTRSADRSLPAHWIGVRKGWEESAGDFGDVLVSLPPERLNTHALVIGATGSGKTNLLHHLMAQDIQLGHSFVKLDLRGDGVAAAIELCAGHVDPALVRVIDLREKARPLGFNPLFGKGEPYFRALSVLDVVAAESESWGVQLSETLRNALLLLAEAEATLTSLEDLFYDRAFRLACVGKCQTKRVRAFWERFDAVSTEKQHALAAPVLNKVSLLLSTETLRRILGHPDSIDLGAHLDTKGSVTLVSLAVDETHAAGRMMGSLVLSSVCREVFSRIDIPERQRNPVRVYVDEFEHFATQDFETVLAEGRRFGLSLVLAHQTLAQLAPRMRSLILGNVGTKVVFRLGREDSATLGKDLFGDGKSHDFTAQPTGQAVFWTRTHGAVEIEVNEPLLPDVGSRSARAKRFLDAVYGPSVRHLDRPEAQPADPLEAQPPNDGLEDWLCD